MNWRALFATIALVCVIVTAPLWLLGLGVILLLSQGAERR